MPQGFWRQVPSFFQSGINYNKWILPLSSWVVLQKCLFSVWTIVSSPLQLLKIKLTSNAMKTLQLRSLSLTLAPGTISSDYSTNYLEIAIYQFIQFVCNKSDYKEAIQTIWCENLSGPPLHQDHWRFLWYKDLK